MKLTIAVRFFIINAFKENIILLQLMAQVLHPLSTIIVLNVYPKPQKECRARIKAI